MRITRIVKLSLISLSFLTIFSMYACENPVTGNGEEVVPQAPRDLTATFYGTHVKLEWKASEGAEEAGYEVYRSGYLLDTVTKDVFYYTDDTIEKGYYYDYSVRTIYEGQTGLSSNTVEVFTGYLWYIDGGDDIICKLDVNDGRIVSSIVWVGTAAGLT
jgi:hypothetical protein